MGRAMSSAALPLGHIAAVDALPRTPYLEVYRHTSDAETTLSWVRLRLPGGRIEDLCDGLEDQHREGEKVRGETRIPAGIYELQLRTFADFHKRYSRRFPAWHIGMIEVMGVPNFSGILWHIGNTDKDTAGCLLLGHADVERMRVKTSAVTYERVYRKIAPMIRDGLLTHVHYIDGDLL